MLKEIRRRFGDFLDLCMEIVTDLGAAMLIGYILGLMALTFFALHTGLHISQFWMYFPVLPWAAAFVCCVVEHNFMESFNGGDKKYRNGSLLMLATLVWPMLVWHLFHDTRLALANPVLSYWLMVGRFWPASVFAAACIAGAVSQTVMRKKKKARLRNAA